MRNSDLRIFSVFVVLVVFSFGLISGYIRHRAAAIDRAALDISDNAAPSIRHLSVAHREVKELQLRVKNHIEHAQQGEYLATDELGAAMARIHEEKRQHERAPAFPDEKALSDRVHNEIVVLHAALDRFIELYTAHRLADAALVAEGEMQHAARRTIDGLMENITLNAQYSQERAQQIRVLRRELAQSAATLNALSVLWTISLVAVLVYGVRRSTLRAAEHRIATERAAELELFAGRVAHDILNPLSVLTYLLKSLEGEPQKEQLASFTARARANIKRIQELLDGLLKFASAGARPEPGVRAEVRDLVAELASELRAQATAANIELQVAPVPAVSVACSTGILSSLLTNLAHNSIKYMGAASVRRIDLRVLERGARVRFEVEDTGPGLSAELQRVVFFPHVRAAGSTQPGFGLGLATVHKAAIAHGGQAGVRSTLGHGSLFWFELPKA